MKSDSFRRDSREASPEGSPDSTLGEHATVMAGRDEASRLC